MTLIPSSEAKLPIGFFEQKKSVLRQIFISSSEMLPLMVFILIRTFGFDIPHRILTGGVLATCIFALYFVTKIKFSPPYFATNLFFILAGAILLLPFPTLSQFFLNLGEVGMFLTILIVGFCWHLTSPHGVLTPTETPPKTKVFSWALLGVFVICPLLAWHFKGNENLAGGLPFIIIVITEKALSYFQSRN
jgi:hypothetical protein